MDRLMRDNRVNIQMIYFLMLTKTNERKQSKQHLRQHNV